MNKICKTVAWTIGLTTAGMAIAYAMMPEEAKDSIKKCAKTMLKKEMNMIDELK